ncbi:hypothetical protein T08_8014 [Trichinella sp. T8]|nr:hypothetical protein T08_8014 [Trichinella sp. T8]
MVVRVSPIEFKKCTKIYVITKINTHFAHYRNGLHHQHRARSYSCVSLGWSKDVTQYWSRNLCGFAYHRNTIYK